MDRRTFLGTLASWLLAAPLAAESQWADKVWRVGFLNEGFASRFDRMLSAIRLGLQEHGYVEGRNMTVDYRWADGQYDRLPSLASELVHLNPDIIITSGTPCTLALKQATSTVPIVMAAIGNAVEAGAVATLARPGGNITGSTFLWEELTAKRVDILKAAVPRLRRVRLLFNPANTAYAPLVSRTIERLAQTLNVTAQPLQVRRLEELEAAFTGAQRAIDAVVVNEEGMFFGGGVPKRIADLAMQERLPSVGFTEYADPGGLMGYGVNFSDLLRRSMSFVDKILKGAKPADLPVQQPTKFEFVINLKTAKALGLTIPPSLLQRADQVIE